MISWRDFYKLGRDRWRVVKNPALKSFMRICGPIHIHPRIRAGHMLRTIKSLDLPKTADILDAGSGRALVLFALAQQNRDYHLRGIELDQNLVDEARELAEKLQLKSLTFDQGDLSILSSVGGPYDLIFSIDVLEHIREDVHVLRTLRDALKPDGTLILHLPLRHQLQWRFFAVFKGHTVSDHVRDEYIPNEVQAKLEEAGLKLHHLRYGFGWQGELAFELNTLFWSNRVLWGGMALLTFPIACWLGFRDVNALPPTGNSMIFVAKLVGVKS